MTNYEIFTKTVNDLKSSTGFYSRIARDLREMSKEQTEKLKNDLNKIPQWKDSVDCILFLEG